MKIGTFIEHELDESLLLQRHSIFTKPRSAKQLAARYEALALTRLSPNFILRDFLFSTEAASMGLSNFPEHPERVIAAGKALCDKILEPTLKHFGQFAITFGYQCRQAIEAGMSKAERANPYSSSPHQYDRQTFGDEIYARVDILPFCVEDGLVTKHEFGHWMMNQLDIDLLMVWTRSNGFCITISPLPRRVWIEWGNTKLGEPRQRMLMGADYWQKIYPYLPEYQRPKFAPSCTGGNMQWRRTT
jgi:hypothetical protein